MEYLFTKYSETCLERPLLTETTCLERPHILGRRSYTYISVIGPVTKTVLRDHFFMASGGGLSTGSTVRATVITIINYKGDQA